MRGKSKHTGYGVRGDNSRRSRESSANAEHRYFGRDCRTTVACRNGEDFSGIPVEWCEELIRVSRIVSEKTEMFDKDEAQSFAIYSVVKVLKDIHERGEVLSRSKLFSVCYSYCLGAMLSMRVSETRKQKSVGGTLNEDIGGEYYDILIDEGAWNGISDKASLLLHTAIQYATTTNCDRRLSYTTKGNIRVRSNYKCDELSLFSVARTYLGWAASTASRVVNELRENFFPNYCVRMVASC